MSHSPLRRSGPFRAGASPRLSPRYSARSRRPQHSTSAHHKNPQQRKRLQRLASALLACASCSMFAASPGGSHAAPALARCSHGPIVISLCRRTAHSRLAVSLILDHASAGFSNCRRATQEEDRLTISRVRRCASQRSIHAKMARTSKMLNAANTSNASGPAEQVGPHQP